MQTWWLSFADSDRPAGQQFLGVVIVDVNDEDAANISPMVLMKRMMHGLPPADSSDDWFAAAVLKTHQLTINPGGECQGHRVDDIAPPDELAKCPRDRLLQKPELAAWGVL